MDYIKDKKEIGKRLKAIRKTKYKSQETFAEALDILDRKTVSKWETGETEIPITRLSDICRLLDCDLDYLFGKIDVPKNSTADIMKETGLSQKAVEKLQREQDNCRMKQFNHFILENLFWEILTFFNMYENVSKELFEENAKSSKIYWDSIASAETEDIARSLHRVSIALEKRKFDYEMNRYKCQILFAEILDKFLPKV